ncbi:MAG: helix-turn-helix transcriptional regulator [Nitrososphaeraceae archaeon]
MARPTLIDSVENINNRRSQVLLLLAEGKTLSQISQQLETSISTINDDNKYIKRQGLKFLGNISKQELSYHYFVSLTNIILINRECLEIAHDSNNVSIKDRLRAYQIVLQTVNSKDNLLQEASKTFAWEELTHKVELLNEQLDTNINITNNQTRKEISNILNHDLLLPKTMVLDNKNVKEVKQLEYKSNKENNKSNNHITNNGNKNKTKTK